MWEEKILNGPHYLLSGKSKYSRDLKLVSGGKQNLLKGPQTRIREEKILEGPQTRIWEDKILKGPLTRIWEDKILKGPLTRIWEDKILKGPLIRIWEDKILKGPRLGETSPTSSSSSLSAIGKTASFNLTD